MDSGNYLVDLLDQTGKIAGQKKRKDIVKGSDIYHAVYVFAVTPEDSLLVSKIAQRSDLPNLHAGSYGATAATIRRSGETAEDAAVRAVRDELFSMCTPELIEESFEKIDNTYRLVGMYQITTNMPDKYSTEDIDELVEYTKTELESLINDKARKTTQTLRRFIDYFLSR